MPTILGQTCGSPVENFCLETGQVTTLETPTCCLSVWDRLKAKLAATAVQTTGYTCQNDAKKKTASHYMAHGHIVHPGGLVGVDAHRFGTSLFLLSRALKTIAARCCPEPDEARKRVCITRHCPLGTYLCRAEGSQLAVFVDVCCQ